MNSKEDKINALQDAGLYEDGLSENDIAALCQVVEMSKQEARPKSQYQDQVSKREDNCTNMQTLKDSSNDAKDVQKMKSRKEQNNNTVDITGTQGCKQYANSDNSTNKSDMRYISKADPNATQESHESSLNEDKGDIIDDYRENKNIDVFSSVASNYKPPSVKLAPTINCPVYCHPSFLSLPNDKKAKIILQHNMLQISTYKKHQSRSINRVPWGQAITPRSDSSDDEAETTDRDTSDQNCIDSSQENVNSEEPHPLQRLRPLKRKSYNESDDELERNVANKKSKANNSKHGASDASYISKSKSSVTEKHYRNYSANGGSHDCTNKIFHNLITEKADTSKPFDNLIKEKTANNISDSSSDDENLPTVLRVVADVHREDESSGSSSPVDAMNNKAHATSTSNNSANADTTCQKQNIDEIIVTDLEPNIPTSSFYGSTVSSSSLATRSKQKCPICQKLFSNELIERHASQCTAYEEASNTEDEKQESDNSSKHLCSICDAYLPYEDVNEHWRTCIKKALLRNK